jgi:hypothetical protein
MDFRGWLVADLAVVEFTSDEQLVAFIRNLRSGVTVAAQDIGEPTLSGTVTAIAQDRSWVEVNGTRWDFNPFSSFDLTPWEPGHSVVITHLVKDNEAVGHLESWRILNLDRCEFTLLSAF